MSNKPKQPHISYGPPLDAKHSHGYSHVRWVEHASRGLRRVGYADEIVSINHHGWYIDEPEGGEVYRGTVFQLPTRDGVPQYAYGYADPCNDDCALLSFDVEESGIVAAARADDFAERFAREERDRNIAWRAGRRVEDLDSEIKEMRQKALTFGAELRSARRAGVAAPAICATVRDEIFDLRKSILGHRKERAQLIKDYGNQDGFVE